MARVRNAPNEETPTERKSMSTLTAEQIQALLAKGRTRGDYDRVLRDYVSTGEPGIEVPLDSGPLAGKTSKQAKTGLDNARKRMTDDGKPAIEGAQSVKVIEAEGHVYLINTAVAVEA